MNLRLNDTKTLQAIGILADVLDDLSGPERLECLMAANALRQVLETRSENALVFAREAFESLESDVRRQIHTDATEAAIKVVATTRAQGTLRASRDRKSTGSPFLDAINAGGMKTERKW
ncbi:hypothetical protein [Azospirillum sp. B4]|uniref:hypothetical protein n=1 Tax=Azospirillum sp. B4 TaxID=95605 RepID=UPI00034856B0|nr:hypothetical protein [Azospirillum sp. B4]